ncbi:MAG: family 10 glycosylhydrolase [Lentisphaerae bacterium]|jgi:hypothetical protein|nr:family 10 glycosylhydrolase [Lentisphaerota bacterium]MBT5606510.1 family 10 glycosylhydrolase [Lentisphaerota bacterium]MBT7842057.1 family 10 glycosylhydrolase [Lentisphaerota bacterium]
MIRSASLAFVLVTTLVLVASTKPARAADVPLPPITNGSFEQANEEGVPVDWETLGGRITDDVVRTGKHSFALIHTAERKTSHLNRYWEARSGKQEAMLPVLSGSVSFWYQVLSASNARIWFGVIPMSAEPWENTGQSRTGVTVPHEHMGDGRWHQAVIDYDYPADGTAKWVHTSCFVSGAAVDLRIDDVEWARAEITITRLELTRGVDGTWEASTVLENTGNLPHKGVAVGIVCPESLALAAGEQAEKIMYAHLLPGEGDERDVRWRLTGTPREGDRLSVSVKSGRSAAATSRKLSTEGCVGELAAVPPESITPISVHRPVSESAPPVPEWFRNVTRVAYTDQSNTSRHSDWPDKVIEDLGKAGVEVFFSRAHSGESWPGVGWRSALSETALGRSMPEDWTGSASTLTNEDAYSGEYALRIEHTAGRRESFLIRRWTGRSKRQGAMLDVLQGTASFRYKALTGEGARIWLGVLPMSAEPWENTGHGRTGTIVPAEHVGDGQWHQAKVPFDYLGKDRVKWIHVGCFVTGSSAEILLDDIELLGMEPQPVTNGDFENQSTASDRTRDVADLCHRHGMRYLAYFWGMREPPDVWRDHPEWKCRDNRRQPTTRFCPNNPGYRQFMKDRFAEIISVCGVDGIFIDMHNANLDEGYCKHCVRLFRAATGEEPPVQEDFGSPLWQAWIRFKYDTIDNAMLDYNRAIKAANPEAVLVSNSWNAWTYRRGTGRRSSIGNSIRLAETVDGMLEELGWYDLDGSLFAFPARFNFMSWHLAGLSKRAPALAWGHPTEWAGGGTTQSAEARIRVLTMITNGAVAAHSVPSRPVMTEYMDDIAQREQFLRGSRLFPWCGLVVSEKTEQWYGRQSPVDQYIKSVYGAFQMMLENHLPMSLVTDRELELGTLEDYRVLFMPNCAAMSNAELATVREFVRNGGGLVATYETSRYDEHAWPRKNAGLGNVLGLAATHGIFDNRLAHWLRPPSGKGAVLDLGPGHRWSRDPILRERMTRGSATTTAGSISHSLPLQCQLLQVESDQATANIRTQVWHPRKTASSTNLTSSQLRKLPQEIQSSTHPGIIETTFGKGKVIYIPADISWAFFRYGHAFLGRIMELAVRDAASAPPPAEVTAPRIVQTMTHQQGTRLVVHLLNDVSSFGRSANVLGESMYIRREILPIHDIRVTFRDRELTRFRLVPGGESLEATPTEQGVTVTVPKLDIHAMVVAEKANAPQ